MDQSFPGLSFRHCLFHWFNQDTLTPSDERFVRDGRTDGHSTVISTHVSCGLRSMPSTASIRIRSRSSCYERLRFHWVVDQGDDDIICLYVLTGTGQLETFWVSHDKSDCISIFSMHFYGSRRLAPISSLASNFFLTHCRSLTEHDGFSLFIGCNPWLGTQESMEMIHHNILKLQTLCFVITWQEPAIKSI